MARQALYRKWRSQSFDDVIGQQHVTETLKNAMTANRVAHAYLFTGPRGTGKTSTARILAKAVNCTGEGDKPCNTCDICVSITEGRLMDLIEIDAASNTSVDDIRDLRDKVGFRPAEAAIKFYIIDEVHMLSKSAFNALLKTLEEPPPHVIFVLATTEPEKIPATIKSRCQRFDFRRIPVTEIVGRLQFILSEEGLQADEDALTFIARQAGGSMRDAISLLDQLTAYGQNVISLDLVHSVLGTAKLSVTMEVVDALLAGDIPSGLEKINQIVADGVEPRQFALEMLEYLRGLMLIRYGDGAQFINVPPEQLETMREQATRAAPAQLLFLTQRFNQTIKEFKTSAGNISIPQLPLELAFVEAASGEIPTTGTPMPRQETVRPAAVVSPRATPTVRPAEPAPPATPPPSETVETLTKESLRNLWPQVLQSVRLVGASEQFLKRPMVQDVEIRENTIVVLFAPEYKMAAKRVEKSKDKIIDAFQSVLGKKWLVEFKVSMKQISSGPESDALVQAAVDLGGKVKTSE